MTLSLFTSRRDIDAKLIDADKSLCTLPHPARIRMGDELLGSRVAERTGLLSFWATVCQSRELGQKAVSMLSDPDVSVNKVSAYLYERSPRSVWQPRA
jgi:hypothetical protein